MEVKNQITDKLKLCILITGATGFIGRNLVRHILAEYHNDYRIVLLCRSKNNVPEDFLQSKSIEILEHDLTLPFDKTLNVEANIIVHLAAKVDFFDKSDINVRNSLQVRHLLEYATSLTTPPKFIFASTLGSVDRSPWDSLRCNLNFNSPAHPRSKYGVGKLDDEEKLSSSHLPEVYILRIPWVVGSGMSRQHVRRLIELSMNSNIVSRINWPGNVGLISNQDLAQKISELLQPNHRSRGFVDLTDITHKVSFGSIFKEGLKLAGHGSNQANFPRSIIKFLFLVRGLIPFQLRAMLFDVILSDTKYTGISQQISENFEDIARDISIAAKSTKTDLFLTGCASGLGWELSKVGYIKGFNVYGVDRVEPSSARYFANFFKGDLAHESELIQIVNNWTSVSVENQKVLINNAGIAYRDALLFNAESFYEIKSMLRINLEAPVNLYYLLQKNVKLSKVINISSSSALVPLADFSIYGATKSALSYWSLASLDSETKFMNVIPSGMNTNLYLTTTIKGFNKSVLNPTKVSYKIYKGLKNHKKILVLGNRARIMLILSKILPLRIVFFLFKTISKIVK
jgi:nucleoside-diphosphate-sugar epimerase